MQLAEVEGDPHALRARLRAGWLATAFVSRVLLDQLAAPAEPSCSRAAARA